MKYAIAITSHLIDAFGSNIWLVYDIMCAFIKTLHSSHLVGDKVRENRLIGIVPAFHRHAHNRKCQLRWHPMYMEGVGTEDFKECEQIFCGSNNLTNVTRLSTPFHRHQEIQEYFIFHDEDKSNIGMSMISFTEYLIADLITRIDRTLFLQRTNLMLLIKSGTVSMS
jgi:hypothetical protein